ncbi:cupin domain-containing protein [Sphaerochaeta globosa]|jgi:quercetin dioxygenase-like cupin family protein|uniref:Cupin 2 conserved barrel domain protein n=1 Tax=Sphaerochaeta globosa (strain ATCC BAA-1886 / DSM 22777 / Buddy) TaxID=158189 RepID=F0RX53_SPHGB|nr:cupin domain-containing protein [Sphaerochaeta globosa]ADY11903.1 Cupin 2 conserved barrel domain protein [Sphaerochaeta globosa str. Buddy]
MQEKKHRGNLATDKRVSRAKGIDRVTLTYDKDNMMCYFYLEKGSNLEMHTHIQSQSGIVIKGHIHFIKGDGEVLDLTAGDAYYFASNDPHGSKILEDTELIECFSPSRDDYKD